MKHKTIILSSSQLYNIIIICVWLWLFLSYSTTTAHNILCLLVFFCFFIQYYLQVKIKRNKKHTLLRRKLWYETRRPTANTSSLQLKKRETIFFCCWYHVFYLCCNLVYLFFTLRMHKYCIPRAVSFSHYIVQHKKNSKSKETKLHSLNCAIVF